jgi:hypothetical protein
MFQRITFKPYVNILPIPCRRVGGNKRMGDTGTWFVGMTSLSLPLILAISDCIWLTSLVT